jgi:antitoxin ParD1/3/4
VINDQSPIRDQQPDTQGEQERCAEIEEIHAALIEGEASGEAKPFDAGAFKQKMLASHG